MIIHQREVRYGEDYTVFFEALAKVKAYLERKHPEVSVDLMYNLAGERTILSHSMGLERSGQLDWQ